MRPQPAPGRSDAATTRRSLSVWAGSVAWFVCLLVWGATAGGCSNDATATVAPPTVDLAPPPPPVTFDDFDDESPWEEDELAFLAEAQRDPWLNALPDLLRQRGEGGGGGSERLAWQTPTVWDQSPWRDMLVETVGTVRLPHHPHTLSSWDRSPYRDLLRTGRIADRSDDDDDSALGPGGQYDAATAATAPRVWTPADRPVRAAREPVHGGGNDRPLRIMVISDLNGSYGSTEYRDEVHAAVRRIIELKPDLVLCTGDMVAGQRARLNYRAMWAAFHEAVTRPLHEAGIPFAVSPGNHDASGYPRFEREREIFVDEWMQWKPDLNWLDDSEYPLRYVFTFGNALFISLDDTTLGPLSADDLAWLDRQLTTWGSAYPTRIVYGHVPLYPFAAGREREARNDPRLEDLLNEHEVQLFISGHHHTYFPGRRGPLRLVSMACTGNGNRFLAGTDERSPRSILEFWLTEEGRVVELDAFGGRGFDERISRWTLPLSVQGNRYMIWRDDMFHMPLD